MRLGILTTHPIQYQAPWFRALAKEGDLEVFFAHRPDTVQQGAGFGRAFSWDVDLLSGYSHRFLKNIAVRFSSSRFFGCDTPEIADIISGKPSHLTPALSPGRRGSGAPTPNSQLPTLKCFDAFIVCGWNLKCYWQAVRACRRAGIPVLVRGDSHLMTPRSRLKTWLKEIIYRMMLRQFDGFLVVGRRNREYLAHYGVPAEKMFFAPHFVDNEWFAAKAEEARGPKLEIGNRKSEIRMRWGISEEAFCVLFCGKFISQKRPMDLVAAARILTAKNATDTSQRPVHLLFVGSGELGDQLREQCEVVSDAEKPSLSASYGERVGVRCASQPPLKSALPRATFAGFLNQSELPAAYVAADVLVLPSESETWGLAVNEAMACGLPAIVSAAVGCAPDLIDEGRTGFTFPMGDTGALAGRLAALANMKFSGHDFAPALEEKLRIYSLQNAVSGTRQALRGCMVKE